MNIIIEAEHTACKQSSAKNFGRNSQNYGRVDEYYHMCAPSVLLSTFPTYILDALC